jgi:two-component SAPR family response regulator
MRRATPIFFLCIWNKPVIGRFEADIKKDQKARFLLKPYDRERFGVALDRVKERIRQQEEESEKSKNCSGTFKHKNL